MKDIDVIIIGAGAAGLMCAIEAGQRGRKVLVLDHANKVGKKILMSGGGRCNFTNYMIDADNYLSANPHFCKSALKRYTPYHFIELVKQHQIPYHEKTQGQLFCDNKASDIVSMLLSLCDKANVTIQLKTTVNKINAADQGYNILLGDGQKLHCRSLVIATGGLSIPTMGASPFGYKLASQFGLTVLPTRAGLVPLTLHPEDKERLNALSGISTPCQIECNGQNFTDDLLLTHRGLSGPAILQISSYWQPGDTLSINLNASSKETLDLIQQKEKTPATRLKHILNPILPKRLISALFPEDLLNQVLNQLSNNRLNSISNTLQNWQIKPNGTEGYRTAEVTLGGVDTNAFSSQTMEVKHLPGLYFIGEVLDVSGWLGGYNFQWAWASGWAAGQVA